MVLLIPFLFWYGSKSLKVLKKTESRFIIWENPRPTNISEKKLSIWQEGCQKKHWSDTQQFQLNINRNISLVSLFPSAMKRHQKIVEKTGNEKIPQSLRMQFVKEKIFLREKGLLFHKMEIWILYGRQEANRTVATKHAKGAQGLGERGGLTKLIRVRLRYWTSFAWFNIGLEKIFVKTLTIISVFPDFDNNPF